MCWACREVYGQQEYDFHVYKELMWGEEAGAPYHHLPCLYFGFEAPQAFCREGLNPI